MPLIRLLEGLRRGRMGLAALLLGACLGAHAQVSCSSGGASINLGSAINPITTSTRPSSSVVNTFVCTNTSTTTTYSLRVYPRFNDGSGRQSGSYTFTPRYLLHTDGSSRIDFNIYFNSIMTIVYPDVPSTTTGVYVSATGLSPGKSTFPIGTPVYAKLLTLANIATAKPGTYRTSFQNDANLKYAFVASNNANSLPTTSSSSMADASPNHYLLVSATFTSYCQMTAPSTLAFGSIDFASTVGPWDASVGNLIVRCTNTTPYQIRLNPGLNYGSTRQMANTSNSALEKIGYKLYKDSARTQEWGDTLNVNTLNATGTGASQTYTVYGRITSLNGRPANYSDTVTVVVTY